MFFTSFFIRSHRLTSYVIPKALKQADIDDGLGQGIYDVTCFSSH